MNKILIASAIAIASLAATTLPSQAASRNDYYNRHHDHERVEWEHDHDRHHRDCFTKVVTKWGGAGRVVARERICR
jgi:Ni/Co efflux regulator RcnB